MRRRSDPRVPLVAGALVVGAAVLAARGRRMPAIARPAAWVGREASSASPEASAADTPTPPSRRDWRCACGQAYVVAGTDRHRVYWLAGAAEDDPVLEQSCPNCGRPLPMEHESAVG